MHRHQDNPWVRPLLITVLVVLLCLVILMPRTNAVADIVVTDREDAVVEKDGDQEATGLDQTTAESITPGPGGFEIKSCLFTPPNPWMFSELAGVSTGGNIHFDTVPDFDTIPYVIQKDLPDEIQVTWVVTEMPSADGWPLIIEGNLHKPGGKGPGTVPKAHWGAVVKASYIDLDVDSDNDDGFNASWARTEEEDNIEADTDKPCRVICVNDNDNDEDRIPDFADGYNRDDIAGNADDDPPTAAEGEKYVPIVIEIDPAVDLTKASLRLVYSNSDPAGVTTAGSEPLKTYTPATGHLRIWTKLGHEKRKKKPFNDPTDPGHYVPPTGSTGEYDKDEMAALGFSSSNREVTLHVEAITESSSEADQSISVTLLEDGKEVGTDLIRMTVIKPDIDVDADRNGAVVDDDDDNNEDIWVTGKGGVVLNNCDDDNTNGNHDNSDANINGPNDLKDLAKLVIQKQVVIPTDWKAFLFVTAEDKDEIRIFDKYSDTGEIARVGGGTEEYEIPNVESTNLDYAMEGIHFAQKDFSGYIPVTIEIRDASNEVHGSDLVMVRIAPFIMYGHGDVTETVYTSDDADGISTDLNAIIEAPAAPAKDVETYIHTNYGDQWIQDEIEIGYASLPRNPSNSEMHVVLDLPRDRGLDPYAEDKLLKNGVGHYELDGPLAKTDDYGGNIEVSPPNSAYPRGRIYHGNVTAAGVPGMDHRVEYMLAAQAQQTEKIEGSITSATATTLKDDTKAWDIDEWHTNAFTVVMITGGKGKGQIRQVTNNTADTLTVSPAWTAGDVPDDRSLYVLSSLLEFDTNWLGVKHVDEVISFNKDGKMIVADPALGFKVLCDTLAKTDAGASTAGAAGSLTHAGKTWAVDEWKDGYIYITGGDGKGQIRRVSGNTATRIDVAPNWDINPPAGSGYKVYALSDSGASTKDGNTAATLEDNNQAWGVNDWQGGFIEITGGALDGQVRQIASNTAKIITVNRNWDPVLDTTTATGATANTVTDTTKAWDADIWNGAEIEVISGPGAGQTRTVSDSTGTTLTVSANWATQPYATDTGTAEAGAATTLTDTDKAWDVDEWKGGSIEITAGTGSGQTREIASNTANAITTTAAWATNPDATSVYTIGVGAELRVILKHPNTTSDYHVTDRALWRAMFFEGDEDNGVSTSSTAPNTFIIDSTKSWAGGEYGGADDYVYIFTGAGAPTIGRVKDTHAEQSDTGSSTAATLTTITDDTQAWTADDWIGAEIEITDGPGKGQVRQITDNTADTLTVTPAWDIQPYAESSGTAEAGAANTITDNDKSWIVDQWKDGKVKITGGTGSGQERTVASNTDTAITVTANWTTQPDATSVFTVSVAGEFAVTLGARLELTAALPAAATEADRYVVVSDARYWISFLAVVTVNEVLNEIGVAQFEDGRGANIATDNMQIWPKIWGETGGTDDIVSVMKDGVGVTDADIVAIPGIWASNPGGTSASAFLPGFVNLLYVNAAGNTVSILPDSFGPYDASGDDIYKTALDAAIPGNVGYADDWYLFHIWDGEVHCGSNTIRETPADVSWWDE